MATRRTKPRAPNETAKAASGRPRMPVERIVATALAIIDAQGPDALSMRALAQRMGSGTATLYRHFANRSALLAAVVDRIFGEAPVDGAALAAAGWQATCRTLAQTVFETVGRHPRAARLLLDGVPTGPDAMAHREAWLAALLAAGFPPAVAARGYATLTRYALGFAIQLDAATGASDDAIDPGFRALDPAAFPATVAVADAMPVPLEQEFAFGLELMIRGLGALRTPAVERPPDTVRGR